MFLSYIGNQLTEADDQLRRDENTETTDEVSGKVRKIPAECSDGFRSKHIVNQVSVSRLNKRAICEVDNHPPEAKYISYRMKRLTESIRYRRSEATVSEQNK